MTVREWFRRDRAAMWGADALAMRYIDDVARLICEQHDPIRPSDLFTTQTTFALLGLDDAGPLICEVELERVFEVQQLPARIEATYLALLRAMDPAPGTYAHLVRRAKHRLNGLTE